ncbi:MAG TPA: penicillin-binding protein 2 [Candidatus Mediterraneibacter intestinavium]|nr:penicillin-binding protein 2 [Candidatus Mediterraneibacter intestinavium]
MSRERRTERTQRRQDRGSKKSQNRERARNKEFARVTYFFVILFIALIIYLLYFTIVRARTVVNSPYNQRQDSFAETVVRGDIVDRNGNVLATTNVADDGTETRSYPYGNVFSHVIGYSDPELGNTGLESVENFELLTSNAFFLEKLQNQFTDSKNRGDTVVTTLDADLQQASYDALGDNRGAVVVMEASTGKILSMVSKPDYDPNSILSDWSTLNSDEENSPLLNRATQGSYAPGSTFKIVTTLAFMRQNSNFADYTYDCSGEITTGDTTIHCFNGTVHGFEDLRSSIANSCNASFANIGTLLDIDGYRDTAEDLLFNSDLPSVLGYTKSSFALTSESSEAEIMMTAMGQGKTTVSPYHMALITQAIANGGTLMEPYLVDSVTNYTGTEIRRNVPKSYRRLMTSDEAAQLKEYMTAVVEEGTGSVLSGSSYTAAGKTGTAEYSLSDGEKTHSWFMGFTNVDNPDLVISVITEGSDGSASGKAVSIAKQILDSYYD